MRRFVILIFALLCATSSLWAQRSADEWLARLNESLGERYAMHLYVAMGDVDNVADQYSGYFMTEGDAYYISLGVMEVFSDGKLRYEVNNERKEVTEDVVNLDAVDLLTNPTRAFNFVAEEYDIILDSQHDSGATLRLTPKSRDMGISSIRLTIARRGGDVVPKDITYDYDGDTVTISLTMADIADAKLPRWDAHAYRAYDIVSFL